MDVAAIEAEAARIRQHLLSHPHPYEHGALYAAQQALAWVLNPDKAASPVDAVLRFQGVRADCHRTSHSEPCERTSAQP